MGIRELAAGENAPLPAAWRLTVGPSSVPLLIAQLNADDRMHGDVTPVAATALPMDLGSLDAAVERCLLVANGSNMPATTVELDLGDTVLRFRTGPPGLAAATVLVEFYRRGTGWKVRALGQSYAGGLAELGRAHGSPPADSPTASTAGSSEAGLAGASPVDTPEAIARHLHGIWEDASRSLIAYAESISFADNRRDTELSALLDDRAARSPDHPDRLAVDARYQRLVDTAAERRLGDLDQLAAELVTLERTFPAPVARWDAPAWRRPIGSDGTGIFRLGTLTRADSRSLKIPMVHGIAAFGGICLENPSGMLDESSVGLLYRVLAALPADSGVQLISDDDQLARTIGLSSPADTTSADSQLAEVALKVDLHRMAAEGGASQIPPAELPGLPGVLDD